MKNQKGITLIALVITIIVLLILAGITIAMLSGPNGLLSKATTAKSDTLKAEAVDKINLALNTVKAEIYEKQAATATWTPITTTGTESEATTTLTTSVETILKTEFGFASSDAAPTYGNEGYSWQLGTDTDKTLTIKYQNTAQDITITGSIKLNASPYEISPATK